MRNVSKGSVDPTRVPLCLYHVYVELDATSDWEAVRWGGRLVVVGGGEVWRPQDLPGFVGHAGRERLRSLDYLKIDA